MRKKNYTLLIGLINIIEELENEHGFEKEINMQDVSAYFERKNNAQALADTKFSRNPVKPEPRDSPVIRLDKEKGVENNIGRLLLLINRHTRNYSKKAFENTPLQTLEEFSYLAMLYNMTSVTKSELINLNFQEKTSGSEVIRRLLANELAVQFDDALDKRSKRVKITDKGKALLESLFRKLGSISELLVHNLSSDERNFLLAILQKLDSFHRMEYSKIRDFDMKQLEALIQKKK